MKLINSSDLQNWYPFEMRKLNATWHQIWWPNDNLNSKRFDTLPWNWMTKSTFVKKLGYMPKFSEWKIKVGSRNSLPASRSNGSVTETLKYNVLELVHESHRDKLTLIHKSKNPFLFWSYIISHNQQQNEDTTPVTSSK